MSPIMPVANLKEFLTFDVDKIIDNSITDFDLFLKIEDHVILYGGIGYKWLKSELEGLLKNGYNTFFVKPDDISKILTYEKLNALPEIEKYQAPAKRIKSIEEVGALFVESLFNNEITYAATEKAKDIAGTIVDTIQEDKTCITALSGLGNYDYYTYSHNIRVAAYLTAIANTMGLNDATSLQELALGGIFHDIGKKEIAIELINKTGALNDKEWQSMRSHPVLGYEILKSSILSVVPQEIIKHHHEKLDGSGYPDGIDNTSLLPEVQISTVADIFDALTSTRSYQHKRSRYQALDFMKHKMLKTKVAIEPFKALISSFVDES